MKLSNQELILQYYAKEQHKYPNLTLEEFRNCCIAPFTEVRECISEGEFKTIRLKFFGTFLIYPKKIKGLLANIEKKKIEGTITDERYERRKKLLTAYLIKNQDEDI